MYTEQVTQRRLIGAPAGPQQLTATTTINSGSIDLSKCRRAFFNFLTGVFGGTSPTLSAACQVQVSADNSTWYASTNNNTSATVTAASKQNTFEIRADQLAQQGQADGRAYRYARVQSICTIGGTSPTIPVCITADGDDGVQKPVNANNDTSVASQNVAA